MYSMILLGHKIISILTEIEELVSPLSSNPMRKKILATINAMHRFTVTIVVCALMCLK